MHISHTHTHIDRQRAMAPAALGRQLAHHKRRLASSVVVAAAAAPVPRSSTAAAGVLFRAFHREPATGPSGALAPEAEQVCVCVRAIHVCPTTGAQAGWLDRRLRVSDGPAAFSINRHIQGPEVVLSRSTVAKTLKKDLAGVEKRLARFRMDAELPGMCVDSRWASDAMVDRRIGGVDCLS